MTNVSFVPEREVKVKTVAEAIPLVGSTYLPDIIVQDLRLTGIDERYDLQVNGQIYHPTQMGFQNFLRSLGIPFHFGMKIPQDLLDMIIHRLREIESKHVQFLVKDSTLINVAPVSYTPPNLARVLDLFKDDPTEFVRISDKGVMLATTTGTQAEPKVGDVIKAGVILYASNTGGPFPKAQMMTYRLVCSNGAVAGTSFGEAKWDKKMKDDGFEGFRYEVNELRSRADRLVPALQSLPSRTLSVDEFRHMWLRASRVIGGHVADTLFGVDEVTRKQFSNAAKAKVETDTGINAYDAFNNLSQCARDLGHNAGGRLMEVTGRLLGSAS